MAKTKRREPLSLHLYRWSGTAATPFVRLLLRARLRKGKEDPARIAERRGITKEARPKGALVWLHAASVGESIAALPLITKLLDTYPRTHLLLTTGTRTSAQLMARVLPARARHHYAPLDHPAYVARFLAHWRPSIGLWIESELWPNMISAAHAEGIPLALVNARLSPASFARWQRAPRMAAYLLACFEVCLAQDETAARRLRALGAPHIRTCGNLKHDAPALPPDDSACRRMRTAIGTRPLWLAASTHPGEEAAIVKAHTHARKHAPHLLTLIAPRHPARAVNIIRICENAGLETARRTEDAAPHADTDVYVIDTIGELDVFYRLAPVVFIGGSLVPLGGHNLLEAARAGCAVFFGPSMFNFAEIAARFVEGGGAEMVADAPAMPGALARLLRDSEKARSMADTAARLAQGMEGAGARILKALAPLLTKAGLR